MRGGYNEEHETDKSDKRLHTVKSTNGNGHTSKHDFKIRKRRAYADNRKSDYPRKIL